MPNTIIQPIDAKCWIVDDHRPGHVNQSLALAASLGIESDTVVLEQDDVEAYSRQCSKHRRMLIGCGRRAARQIVTINRQRPGSWISVQILDPIRDRNVFDWLLVPEHDKLSGSHVLTYCGALNPVNDSWLATTRDQLPAFGELPGPRLGVLIGGPIRRCRWTEKTLHLWLEQAVVACNASNGSLLVAGSRRTRTGL